MKRVLSKLNDGQRSSRGGAPTLTFAIFSRNNPYPKNPNEFHLVPKNQKMFTWSIYHETTWLTGNHLSSFFFLNVLTIKLRCLIQEIHIFFVHFRDFLPRFIPPAFPKPHQQVPVPLRCEHSCQICGNKMVNEQQLSICKTKWYLIQISWKYPKFPTTSRNFEKLFIITAEDFVSQDLCTSVKKCNREWFTSLM